MHLGFRVWGIAPSGSFAASRTFGRLGAGIYAALVAFVFIDSEMFGLVPIGSHDIWLHALPALGLAYIGFATPERAHASAPT